MAKENILDSIKQILINLCDCNYGSEAWQEAEAQLKKLLSESDQAREIMIELLLGFGTDPMGSTRLGTSGILLHGAWGSVLGSLNASVLGANRTSSSKRLQFIKGVAQKRKGLDQQKLDFISHVEKARQKIIRELIEKLDHIKQSQVGFRKK